MYPKIHLALDNCFASKRWTHPSEWIAHAKDFGVYGIEASADNECDPLYAPPDTLNDWLDAVKTAADDTGVQVVNLFSGHGTYATLGLAHPDERVRDHIQHHWLDAMIANAASLGAGLGFYCHAFSQATMKDPELYAAAIDDLYRRLGELAQVAAAAKLPAISVEQMYSPHQVPWTISGTLDLVRQVYQRAGDPMYITMDLGHVVGQQHFQMPTREQVEAYLEAARNKQPLPDISIGSADVRDYVNKPTDALMTYLEERPHLFAQPEDGDLYEWLRQIGRFSPIVHLQQTDGNASAHRPFTPEYNAKGIVDAQKVLQALSESYQQHAHADDPPPVTDIYLTIEVFSGTAQRPETSLNNIRETAAYWRQYVPEDGVSLESLLG